jgi:hypothetical protein
MYVADAQDCLVLSNSIPKNVRIGKARISFHKGDTVAQITDKIRFDEKVSVKGFKYILIHAGTNDLSGLIEKNLLWCTSIHEVFDKYIDLNGKLPC